MYVVDPTEETIQLDGSWTSCPSGDLVTLFTAPSTCSSERDTVFFRQARKGGVH